jgi:hypothetical protein
MSETLVPPGNYSVEAFDVEEIDDGDETRQRISARVAREVGEVPNMLRAVLEKRFATGCVTSLAGAFAILWLAKHEPGVVTNPPVWLASLVAVVIGVLAVTTFAIRRFPGVDEAQKRFRELLEAHPETVVVLRRLPDDADVSQMPTGAFGRYSS